MVVEAASVAFETLADEAEQHFAAVVAERGRFVGMNDESVWSNGGNVVVVVGIRNGYRRLRRANVIYKND